MIDPYINLEITDKPIFIPKHQYHRLIKGNGKLRVKINKLP